LSRWRFLPSPGGFPKGVVNLAMTDQGLVLSAMRQVGLIIAEHLELGTDADEVITRLVAVLDTNELAEAINRLERGFGLRVVK
jgi:hypothetical protein